MENIKSQVLEDLKVAMKEKNTSKLEAIRATKAAIDKFEKENPNQEINYIKALKPLVKQREDSILQFKNAGNVALLEKETTELNVINSYLLKVMPKQLSKEEMEEISKKYVTDNSLGKTDMGKIMSHFKAQYDGQYDGKELSLIAKNVLA